MSTALIGDGRWPVILYRFITDPSLDDFVEMGTFFSRRGYVFVYNDVRGTVRSDGDFFPLVDEAWGERQDGYDAVEWAGSQPWSNGHVGLIGTSYGAFNQYTTAPTRPPSLKACMPFYGSNIHETVFPNGFYRLEEHRAWALWMALNCLDNEVSPEQREAVYARVQAAREDHDSWIWRLPVTECPGPGGCLALALRAPETPDRSLLVGQDRRPHPLRRHRRPHAPRGRLV